MVTGETELDMVRRHVRQGERHVREQHVRIARLKELGNATIVAEDLLEEMLMVLDEHRLHLARLLA